jgi:hypothetical protein
MLSHLLVALVLVALLGTANAEYLIAERFVDPDCNLPLYEASVFPADVCRLLSVDGLESKNVNRVMCRNGFVLLLSCDASCDLCRPANSAIPVNECVSRTRWYCSNTLPQAWGATVAYFPRQVRKNFARKKLFSPF